MLSTDQSLGSWKAETRHAVQWTVETRYNEYYVNRYICLLEERVGRAQDSEAEETDEQVEYLVFSVWNVDMGVSNRLIDDEEKSVLLDVFGWLPAMIQLRRGPLFKDVRQNPLSLVNFTTRSTLTAQDFSSFWHFANRWLQEAPRAVFHPAKIAVLSLCEQADRSQPYWEKFLTEIGFASF